METKYEIQGELVREIRFEVVKELTLADVTAHLERRPPVAVPLLPRNHVEAIYWDESTPPTKSLSIAVSIPPAIREIPIRPEYQIEDLPPRLACPTTVFVYKFTTDSEAAQPRNWQIASARIFFARQQIQSMDDQLIAALLPNVYASGELCWGDTGVPTNLPLHERIDGLTNSFYTSLFNHGNMDAPWPYRRPSYRRWAIETQRFGRTAYRRWTDWDDPQRNHWTLAEAMEYPGDRAQPIILPDGIPDLVVNPTFGAAEDWVGNLASNNARLRLEAALASLREDRPELFEPEAIPAAATDDEDDEEAVDIHDADNAVGALPNDDDDDEEDDD